MAFLPLTRGYVATIDDEDLEYLKQWKWHIVKNKDLVYALRGQNLSGRRITRMLHNEVLRLPLQNPLPKGYVVDHKNRDSLDCRKRNLRICTVVQNNWNCRPRRNKKSSRYKGVCWVKDRKLWKATIQHHKDRRFLGYFKYEYPAVNAYNMAALGLHGPFAYINLWNGPTPYHGDPDQAPPVYSPRFGKIIKRLIAAGCKYQRFGSPSPPLSPYDSTKPPGVQLLFDFM